MSETRKTTPPDEGETTKIAATTGHDNDSTRPKNPYSIRLAKFRQIRIEDFSKFVHIVDNYLKTIVRHDPFVKQHDWYSLWAQWVDDDILQAVNLHMVAVTIKFPSKERKTNKTVGKYILDRLSILDKYMKIPPQTRHEDPILQLTGPILTNIISDNYAVKSTDNPDFNPISQYDNNPFNILRNEDKISLNDKNSGDNLKDMEEMEELAINQDSVLPKPPALIPPPHTGDEEHINVDRDTSSKNEVTIPNTDTPSLKNLSPMVEKIPSEKRSPVIPHTPGNNQTLSDIPRNLIHDMQSVSDAINKEYQEITDLIETDKGVDITSQDIEAYLSKHWDRKTAEFDIYVGAKLKIIDEKKQKFQQYILTKDRNIDGKFSNLANNHKAMETKLNADLARIKNTLAFNYQ